MIKSLYTTCLFVLATLALSAQTFQQISTGAGYSRQSYISLSEGIEQTVPNNAWDIAFSVQGQTDGGIFINESAGTSMGVPQNSIALFNTMLTDFNDAIDEATLTEEVQLFNAEIDWQNGAFNALKDPANPFDYGWGAYNPQTHQLAGSAVYAIQLRDGSFKKFQMLSLSGGAYNFKYANLDGSDEVTASIAKADHAGKTLAYFSFATGATVDVEPEAGFDLLFQRYLTPLYDADNDIYIPYAVTGILHGNGVQTAQVQGIDPATVEFDGHQAALNDSLDIIGYDWKTFDFNSGWLLPEDLVYFVKTAENRVWKLQFVDFEGSTTGTAVFEKTDLGIISSVSTPAQYDLQVLAYPNPVIDKLAVSLSTPQNMVGEPATLVFHNAAGVVIKQYQVTLQGGLQVYECSTGLWPAGLYFMSLQIDGNLIPLGKICKGA